MTLLPSTSSNESFCFLLSIGVTGGSNIWKRLEQHGIPISFLACRWYLFKGTKPGFLLSRSQGLFSFRRRETLVWSSHLWPWQKNKRWEWVIQFQWSQKTHFNLGKSHPSFNYRVPYFGTCDKTIKVSICRLRGRDEVKIGSKLISFPHSLLMFCYPE